MFREGGYNGWTMRHAFFADMGGFLVKTTNAPTPVPITAKQLLTLLRGKYVPYPVCDEAAIKDKNKQDGLAR